MAAAAPPAWRRLHARWIRSTLRPRWTGPCTGTGCCTFAAHQVRQAYEQYLLRERGLAAASARLYGDAVGRFLGKAFGEGEVQLHRLTPADIVGFVQAEASRLRHPKRAKVMISALRSFLQYGRYRGDITVDLHGCVPTVANWTKAGLPKTISPSQVQRLLEGCDSTLACSPCGAPSSVSRDWCRSMPLLARSSPGTASAGPSIWAAARQPTLHLQHWSPTRRR